MTLHTIRSTTIAALLGSTTVVCAGCIETLESGELGQLRYIGDYRGEDHFRSVPPIADLTGNVYYLYGSPQSQEVRASVGFWEGGGWRGQCVVHKNPGRGVHGWVGYTFEHAYFWSGDALAELGANQNCRQLLDRDPVTAADLSFKAVIPWARVRPTTRTLVALIQSPSDPVPFQVVVDLDLLRYTRFEEFTPRAAQEVQFLGVGADPDDDSGFFVVKYSIDETVRVEGRFIDQDAQVTDIVNLPGLEMLEEDAMTGFMQVNGAGWVAGVLDTGEVVTFNRESGGFRDAGNLEPVGVHKWEGDVWIVGTANGRPAIARVNDAGNLEKPRVWESAEATARALQGQIVIQDDRFTPYRTLTWNSPTAAVGPFPLLYSSALHPYTDGETVISVAGPSYMTAGQTFTSVAVGPVGVSYP